VAETNVAYASDDLILESLVVHTAPDFGPQGDGIINQNMLLSFLKDKKRINVVDGGLEFWRPLIKAENSNFKWQSHTADMSANLQDPSERMRWAIKTFTGSIVINELHKAQNKGRAAIKSFAKTLTQQAESTIPNLFNSAFWNTSPGSDEPDSVPNIINATNTSGYIGGLDRSGREELQNGVDSTTYSDIGSEAGISALNKNIADVAVTNGDFVDLIVMDSDNYSGLKAYLDSLRRFTPNDRMAKLGFDTIQIGNTVVGYEKLNNIKGGHNTISDGYVYGINSKYFFFDVLKDGNFKWNPKGFERVGNTLSSAYYFWVFCNVSTNLPCSHFVMTSVSTS
jgi:hypothetical protein